MRKTAGRWRVGVRALEFMLASGLTVWAQQGVLQKETPTQIMRPLDSPRSLPGPRPSAKTIEEWGDRRFGMFIHFGLYSELGGVWDGKNIDNGYSEQIEANAPVPPEQYAALAKTFNPTKWDPDAIVALAKAAGMKFIVITSKHHDGFNMFGTRQTKFNVVDDTPYRRDIVKSLADACARGGIRFGVYYSSIDWHDPRASKYIEGNSNPIPKAHEDFNVAQLKELLSNYGPITEIWFDMGKPMAEQSARFQQTVHDLQPQTMVSGRVFNYEGDFTVMGDNEVPAFTIDEPWQTPASIYGDTWGYRSWQKRDDLPGKTRENVERLVEVVSRGGNYILNIGPKGDGSVVPFEADVLRGVGNWLKVNGPAIYVTQAQPFRKLDFGYATVKHEGARDVLYLFVKDVPADGVLRLPGLSAANVSATKPHLLADATKAPLAWKADANGDAGVAVPKLAELQAKIAVPEEADASVVRDLPVIVIPLTGRLVVKQPSFAPNADGSFTLPAKEADRFLNYNGYGYEDPATTYKLRWRLASKPGQYRVIIEHAAMETDATMDLVLDGTRMPLHMKAGATETSTDVSIHEKTDETVLELTPSEPFYKGTKLAAKVETVMVVPR
jgi:alpha-L-fucosidase